MKNGKHIVLAHLFLNLYLLALLQPLYPVLEYVIHYDYIVAELCENREKPLLDCHGKCYLGKQLANVDVDSQETPAPMPPSVDFDKLMTTPGSTFYYFLLKSDGSLDPPSIPSFLMGKDHHNHVFRPPIL